MAPSAQRGFTIIEILMAIVVLVVGLVGIIALFPPAVATGNKTVEDTYAATIAQSVLDAVQVGIRDNRYVVNDSVFCVLECDGVKDLAKGTPLPDKLSDPAELRNHSQKDWFILLPIKATDAAGAFNKTFVYPETDQNRNGGGLPDAADDDAAGPDDEYDFLDADTGDRFKKPVVSGTYQCGAGIAELAQAMEAAGRPREEVDRIRLDPYGQYSFSLQLKRSRIDSDGDGTLDQLSPSLFELRIRVYRNFNPNPETKQNEPVKEFVTLVSM